MLSQTAPDEQSNLHLVSEDFRSNLLGGGVCETWLERIYGRRKGLHLNVILTAYQIPEIPARGTIGHSQRLDAIVSSFES
jgi:hypothetical protein